MEKNRRKARKIFWIVVIAGSALLGVQEAALGLERADANLLLMFWLLCLFIASIWIDLFWGRKLQRKLMEIQKILLEEKDADRYIEELQKLFAGAKRKYLLDSYYVNLSAAYAEKKEYEKALDCLEKINPNRLRGQIKAAYWANKSLFCFHAGKGEEGRRILREQETLFFRYREQPYAAEVLGILPILEQMSLGHWQEAESLLAPIKEKKKDSKDRAYFDGLAEICQRGKEGGIIHESELG